MSANSHGKAAAGARSRRITPGEHLRAEIQRLGLDQVAVSKATGVSRQSVNNIVNGRQPISRAMAGKLGRLTGRSSDYWLSDFYSSTGKSNRPANGRASDVGVLVDHQIIRAVEDGVIGIAPFMATNVRAAAVDLTLGKDLTLAPGAAIAVQTRESIQLPLDYLGHIGAAARLASLSIIATHASQVGPGFEGSLDVCLFNAGAVAFRLGGDEAVVNLEILRLNATPNAETTT